MQTKIRPVRGTSLLAFAEALETIGQRQLEVLRAIDKLEPCNNLMVSEYLNLPINSITPRCQELRRKGLVKESHIGKCPKTGRMTIFFRRVRK